MDTNEQKERGGRTCWFQNQKDKRIKTWYLQEQPSITYRRSKNLKDHLVKSYYRGPTPNKLFGSKGPKWGCKTCGSCVACPNIENSTSFWNSSK
ncbi:hypothetical protein GDO81_016978 [Engystomops pustulosus]|uniref:Uncharacterized protein n=1 Tax=Engystomops pustulosus TaxID=76066 RepID=A0AAV7AEQ7_ENGPU|nr:hypothetical protein GDO81_016978 [Engystomops pustulosus]